MLVCWLEVQRTVDWQGLDPRTRHEQILVAERFFATTIAQGTRVTFGRMPIAGLHRGDIKRILTRYSAHPHAGGKVLRLLRKLTLTALDLEWIEADPTHRLKYRPKLIGHRAWSYAEIEAFEGRWAPGSTPRLGYALALYTGQRAAISPPCAGLPMTAAASPLSRTRPARRSGYRSTRCCRRCWTPRRGPVTRSSPRPTAGRSRRRASAT
jgi:hypothetical protein